MSQLSDLIVQLHASADAALRRAKDDHEAEEQKVRDALASGGTPTAEDRRQIDLLRRKIEAIDPASPVTEPTPPPATVGDNSTHPDTGAPVTSEVDPTPAGPAPAPDAPAGPNTPA